MPPRHDRDRPSPPPDARIGSVPERYLEPVLEDAAQRAGVPRERLEVTRAEAAQWRDGSLGCPEPGMMYTQAIVDGYWVEVAAAGEEFDYRLDNRGSFRLCEEPNRLAPRPGDR